RRHGPAAGLYSRRNRFVDRIRNCGCFLLLYAPRRLHARNGLVVAEHDWSCCHDVPSRVLSQPDERQASVRSGTSGHFQGLSMAFGVECRGLKKDFGEGETRVRALRGVDLDVPCGMMTMLAGPSGCGKTTLLSVIAGVMQSAGGNINVLGERI